MLKRDGIPGMAIALIRDGRVAWAGGYGIRNSVTLEPVAEVALRAIGGSSYWAEE